MYNVQCTMYNVQCTMYNVQCTMYVLFTFRFTAQCAIVPLLKRVPRSDLN